MTIIYDTKLEFAMTDTKPRTEFISEILLSALKPHDADAVVRVRSASWGWLKLYVASTVFEGQDEEERERYIDGILQAAELSLFDFPFQDFFLFTPEETQTKDDIIQTYFEQLPIPLWSDILLAPDPEEPKSVPDDSVRPLIATFYSFKGGVGRTTSLALVASALVKQSYRVVVIDFDLEAPGLSFVFPNIHGPTFGVLDYLYLRIMNRTETTPQFDDFYYRVEVPARGELYVIPTGKYDEGYIHRLADLDLRVLYQRAENPFHQLLEDAKRELDPDVILIDARTGFTEMGAIALLDSADLGVICFLPSIQSYLGLEWVVQAADRQQQYQGKPDLRFILTPIPPVDADLRQEWMNRFESWLSDHWRIPPTLSAAEMYAKAGYNPEIQLLRDYLRDPSDATITQYAPIVEAITASIPNPTPRIAEPTITASTTKILDELDFRAATAGELKREDIRDIFQKTGDFVKFLEDRTWLVRGAKGTGKSILFRLFVEQPKEAVQFARPTDLDLTRFIAAHGSLQFASTLLSAASLESYANQTHNNWDAFWRNYGLLRLVRELPFEDMRDVLDPRYKEVFGLETSKQIVNWFVSRSTDPQDGAASVDQWRAVDNWLAAHGKKVWLFYDELDAVFKNDYTKRTIALNSLFVWWAEMGLVFTSIKPKLFIREDIWKTLNFTNIAHVNQRSIKLTWSEDDLWRLVLRQALNSSPTFRETVRIQVGIEKDLLDNTDLERLRMALYILWGERMGRGKKAFSYNWVRNRITDSQKNSFPRSLMIMLKEAIGKEKDFVRKNDKNMFGTVLRPRSLIDSMKDVSESRVGEVRDEYPDLAEALDNLKGKNSPIEREQLRSAWQGLDAAQDDKSLDETIQKLIAAGVIELYRLDRQKSEGLRYVVSELYLSGLGMTRRGQR